MIMLKTILLLILGAFITNVHAIDLPTSSSPEGGVENIASHDLDESHAWWADNFDEEKEKAADPDPLEPVNRVLFSFNRVLDGTILKPLAIMYNDTFSDTAKTGVSNFIDNAFAPVSVFNSSLQGEGERAVDTLCRFAVNTVFGVFGLIDVAKETNKEKHFATFNQTLATWGVETGPYLMIPFVGPSTFRGAFGLLADWAMNPLYYIAHNKHRLHNRHRQQIYLWYALYGVDIINRRSKLIEALNDIEKNSLDPYATIRSIYFQKQAEMEREIQTRKHKKAKASEV
jgi:phospholipid-binding lipoprotein MlaA